MRRRSLGSFLALVCGVAASPWLAQATVLRALDLGDLSREADQIVVADVASARAEWDRDHRAIHTTVELAVKESWKGAPPASGKLVIRQLGGVVGQIEMTIHGMATFAPGERALVFLKQSQVVGMGQGKRSLRWDQARGRWQADPPDLAGAALVRATNQAGSENPGEDLDHLRARVRALIEK